MYVAEHGHVYNVDPMCSHIHLTIHMVGESQTEGYGPCEKCMQDGKEYGHPTIKPIDIIKNLVENSSESGG